MVSHPVAVALHKVVIRYLIYTVVIPGHIHIVPFALILHSVPCMITAYLDGYGDVELTHDGIESKCISGTGRPSLAECTVSSTFKGHIPVKEHQVVMHRFYLLVITL